MLSLYSFSPQPHPPQAQFATIAAGGSYTFLFTITMTTDQTVPSSTCAIQIADFEGEILAVSSVTWHTNGTNYESPTNDGTGSPPVRRRWRWFGWALGVVHAVSTIEQCLTNRIAMVTISHTPLLSRQYYDNTSASSCKSSCSSVFSLSCLVSSKCWTGLAEVGFLERGE